MNINSIQYNDLLKYNSSYLREVQPKRISLFQANNRKESLPIIIDYGSNTFKAVYFII